MAFQAEQKIKSDILRGLSTEQLFQLLSDSDVNVLMKTLGLLRNLLSTRPVSRAANRPSESWSNMQPTQCFCAHFSVLTPRGFIQIFVSKCANQCERTFERILFIHGNAVIIIRARHFHLMFSSIAFSFQQHYFHCSFSVKLVQNNTEGCTVESVYGKVQVLMIPVFLLPWYLKYFCSYPSTQIGLALWIWLWDRALTECRRSFYTSK